MARRQTLLVDADATAREPRGGQGRDQGVERVAVVGQRLERGQAGADGIQLRHRAAVHVEGAVAPHRLDPGRLVGEEVEGAAAGYDGGLALARRGPEDVGLGAAANPLRQRPEAAGVGDVLRRRGDHRVETAVGHLAA